MVALSTRALKALAVLAPLALGVLMLVLASRSGG